ncbi:hypothetical protein [Dokdonella soli]|uniref:Uncharacterized protein n=1 Tax=Dokdonella soli TaxID=529810 RepID=A0ABN1ITX4_9GAMM
MTGVPDDKLIRLGPWPAGVNTLAKEDAVPAGELRQAVNVDIDRDGIPSRRLGQTLRYAGTRVHSIWNERPFPFGLFVQAGTLMAFWPDTSTSVLQTGLAPLLPVANALVYDRVYWSNGQQLGVVTSSGAVTGWGVETPDGQANLASAAAGGLNGGQYQVTFTFVSATGEESGAYGAATVTVPDGGGIAVTAVPQPLGSGVTAVRAYRTPANGDAFYYARDLPVGLTSVTLTESALGKPLDTQFLDRMPAVTRLALLNGRLYGAAGPDLVWSEPLRYGLTHPLKNRIGFGHPIDLLVTVGDGTDGAGLYIAAGARTYFLGGGEPDKFTRQTVRGYGVTPGSGLRAPGSVFGLEHPVQAPVAYWIDAQGIACLGLPGGSVQGIRERQAAAPLATSAVSLLREQNGVRQIITSLRGPAGQGLSVVDTAVASVTRNGVPMP